MIRLLNDEYFFVKIQLCLCIFIHIYTLKYMHTCVCPYMHRHTCVCPYRST